MDVLLLLLLHECEGDWILLEQLDDGLESVELRAVTALCEDDDTDVGAFWSAQRV